jgi:hypothetical protein
MDCSQIVLCALSAPVRAAIVGVLTTLEGAIEVARAQVAAQLAVVDVVLIPLQVSESALAAVAGGLAQFSNLVPFDSSVARSCVELGDFSKAVQTALSFSEPLQALQALQTRLRRQLAWRDKLQADILELDLGLSGIRRAKTVLQECRT